MACVAIPACNLTPEPRSACRAFDAAAGGALLVDTGWQLACPGAMLGDVGLDSCRSASMRFYGAAACRARRSGSSTWPRAVWSSSCATRGTSRAFWTSCGSLRATTSRPAYNASFGAAVTHGDSTRRQHRRVGRHPVGHRHAEHEPAVRPGLARARMTGRA
ncbi:hypothetical protein ACU4GD_28200 [Cupriavidus basilensis]